MIPKLAILHNKPIILMLHTLLYMCLNLHCGVKEKKLQLHYLQYQ